jgi:hypothetical protein
MFAQTITNEEKVTFTLAPKTAGGADATVDGAPVWEVTDGDATVEPAADGLSAVVRPGTAGTLSTITVTADADMGEGVTNISEDILLTTVAAGASSLGLSAVVEPNV